MPSWVMLTGRVLPALYVMLSVVPVFSQKKDSVALLKAVKIAVVTNPNNFTSVAPIQSLNHETLQQLNAPSVGDAARYFSGVLVKDYGGAGGLKTVSVRSLGASSTGIVYDGIPVSDVQTGQVDLSRYSTTFIQSLELQQGGFRQTLSPARVYAPAASLAIASNTFTPSNLNQQKWQAGIKAGSFNSWQPFTGIYQPLKKNIVININAEALYSKGNYPFYIDNGNFSTTAKRDNSDIKSVQTEASILKQFDDSSTLQLKTGLYAAERGLPGAIVFFNNRSVQRLANTDFFAQGRYRQKIGSATAVLVSAKYSHTYTGYTDPDFLNNQGGLDSRYRQQEMYVSVAGNHFFGNNFTVSAASDIAYNKLSANKSNFAFPSRTSFWEHIGLQYAQLRWQANASLLYTGINDKTEKSSNAASNHKFTPAVAISFTPAKNSSFMLRVFYKASFRMPTFNDLYYNFIDSSSLKPEYAQQYNAGITYSKQFTSAFRRLGISADIYYNEVKDKIIAVPGQNLFVWTMRNLGKVSIRGIDINTEARGVFSSVAGWFIRMAYTWQRAIDITDKTGGNYKNTIPYTPDHSGSGLLSFNYKKWDAGCTMLFSGTRYTLGDNNPYNQLDGWLTQDVFVSRVIPLHNFQAIVKAELNNISDERFDIVRYYPMPGRSFKISLLFNNL